MEQETLYTAAKWDILRALSRGKKAPIELAEETNTSISNISQSLRFLELAGLITSERISNRDKGQPRVVYSLSKDSAYIILTSQGFAEKKQIDLDERKKIFLKIWMYHNPKFHRFVEKAFENIESDLDNYSGIAIQQTSIVDVVIHLVPTDSLSKKTVKEFSFEHLSVNKKIRYVVSSWDSINKDSDEYYVLYDPLSKYREDKK